jgi:hypothetical protein
MLPEASLSFSYIYVRLGGMVKTRSVVASVARGAPVRPLSRFKSSPDPRRAEKRETTILVALYKDPLLRSKDSLHIYKKIFRLL